MLLNIHRRGGMLGDMKHMLASLAVSAVLALAATAAQAACYADYKAKQDNPLRLHYGVMQVSACDAGAARAEIAARLAANGWTLLNVLSVFDETGLARRQANAGQYYLRY